MLNAGLNMSTIQLSLAKMQKLSVSVKDPINEMFAIASDIPEMIEHSAYYVILLIFNI